MLVPTKKHHAPRQVLSSTPRAIISFVVVMMRHTFHNCEQPMRKEPAMKPYAPVVAGVKPMKAGPPTVVKLNLMMFQFVVDS